MQFLNPAENGMYEKALKLSLSFSEKNLSGIKSKGFSQSFSFRAMKYGNTNTVVSFGKSLPSEKRKVHISKEMGLKSLAYLWKFLR